MYLQALENYCQLGILVICEYVITYFAKTRISHNFPHLMAFFKIAYAKIMLHIQKFAHMPHISAYAIAFFSIFLVQHCFKIAKYFDGK